TETENGQVEYRYEVPENADCCIVMGGDGTMLQAAVSTFDRDIPLIGVNIGTLGYLTEVELEHLEQALDRLLADDVEIRERMMLRGMFEQQADEFEFHALNDIVIARCSSLRVIPFHIYVNGLFLTRYEGDGILLSTPTGSTGYNMSAGGPIVEPEARVILLTPICPHTMGSRTIVLSPQDEIVVELAQERRNADLVVEASFDGMSHHLMRPGDRIHVSASTQTTRILRLNRESFLETLHRKL
ncbi:MAG: NAD(+)/NADH kinase, partial [Butyrivibrio sp.]|nr:NAD(+)/NADH kinase [Butyrivibrio sp.]